MYPRSIDSLLWEQSVAVLTTHDLSILIGHKDKLQVYINVTVSIVTTHVVARFILMLRRTLTWFKMPNLRYGEGLCKCWPNPGGTVA